MAKCINCQSNNIWPDPIWDMSVSLSSPHRFWLMWFDFLSGRCAISILLHLFATHALESAWSKYYLHSRVYFGFDFNFNDEIIIWYYCKIILHLTWYVCVPATLLLNNFVVLFGFYESLSLSWGYECCIKFTKKKQKAKSGFNANYCYYGGGGWWWKWENGRERRKWKHLSIGNDY